MGKIQPIFTVRNENVMGMLSASNSNAMVLGDCLAIRKFDPSVIMSGSWNEIWIGLRWKMDGINWKRDTTSANIGRLAIGVCDTTKPLPGEFSGSYSPSQMGHALGLTLTTYGAGSIGLSLDTVTVTGSFATALNLTTASFGLNGVNNLCYYYQRTQSISNASPYMSFALNGVGTNEPIHTLYAIRIATGSATVWTTDAYYASTSGSALTNFRPMVLADAFSQSNWTAVGNVMKSSSLGFIHSGVAATLAGITQSAARGYFDGMFIHWGNRYDKLVISDVIVKAF